MAISAIATPKAWAEGREIRRIIMRDYSSPQTLPSYSIQTCNSDIPQVPAFRLGIFSLSVLAYRGSRRFHSTWKIARPCSHYGGDAIIVSGLPCPIAASSTIVGAAPNSFYSHSYRPWLGGIGGTDRACLVIPSFFVAFIALPGEGITRDILVALRLSITKSIKKP